MEGILETLRKVSGNTKLIYNRTEERYELWEASGILGISLRLIKSWPYDRVDVDAEPEIIWDPRTRTFRSLESSNGVEQLDNARTCCQKCNNKKEIKK